MASGPDWWQARNVIDANSSADDYAPVILGQLKWFATNAYDECEANLPAGAGTNLDALVGSLSNTDNWAVANVGQLKNMARPFYDRLIEEGVCTNYPWTAAVTDDVDNAVANIGQLKSMFNFTLTVDTDADGLADWWEMHWFSSLTNQTAAHTGNSNFIRRYTVPKRDWLADELRQRTDRERTRAELITQGRTNEAARLPVYVIRPKPQWLVSAELADEPVKDPVKDPVETPKEIEVEKP
jgi:hypothetical protein